MMEDKEWRMALSGWMHLAILHHLSSILMPYP
jgi:hypothetical protein